MISRVFVFVCAALLVIQVSSIKINVKPHDAIDDAQVSLETLREIVNASISSAENDLDDLQTDFSSYVDKLLETGTLDIDQEHGYITREITVLRDLGFTAGVDVSSCIDIREQVLNRLPDQYKNQMSDCIVDSTGYVTRALTDSKYYVDVYISRVANLDFQLGQCTTEGESCISRIVTQIELGMVQLPEEIRVEVDQATDLVAALEVKAQDCSNTRVAEYAGDANSILRDITACVNRLFS